MFGSNALQMKPVTNEVKHLSIKEVPKSLERIINYYRQWSWVVALYMYKAAPLPPHLFRISKCSRVCKRQNKQKRQIKGRYK